MQFQNKVVLITGGSTGIGRATALAFAKEGANIVVNYIKFKEKADSVCAEIKNLGTRAIAINADITQETEVKEMLEKTIIEFGRIDVLVNNAGIIIDLPFKDRTVEHWKNTLNINLIGMFICSKQISEIMKKQNSGCIINLSSSNGIDSYDPMSIDYDCSKAGVIMLTKDLAKELGPNIRVNSVAPGWVKTDMNAKLPEDFVKEEMEKIYMKRICDPMEIANVILFLASDKASYINGITIKVDGGHG
jgi:3-oxoacyl-[acyl-carrier protein] reductase